VGVRLGVKVGVAAFRFTTQPFPSVTVSPKVSSPTLIGLFA